MKSFTHNITAIVTVADDGGSSGRLRQEMGILPPGDIRNCLAALSNDEALLAQLFQYRFPDGNSGWMDILLAICLSRRWPRSPAALRSAVAESGRVLAFKVRSCLRPFIMFRLEADVMLPSIANEVRIQGESKIPEANGKVRRVWIEPGIPRLFPRRSRQSWLRI